MHWAYVDSLPGEEIVETLPIGWSDEDLEQRVRGTTLLEEVRTASSDLRALADALASVHDDNDDGDDAGVGVVSGDSGVFPSAAFGLDALRWAYAVFWSRALVLQLPGGFGGGGGTECLVPLLDMCNHRAGTTTELRVRGGHFELLAGRSVKLGEEVCINYGAKGNGELLRCHGFVVGAGGLGVGAGAGVGAVRDCTRLR